MNKQNSYLITVTSDDDEQAQEFLSQFEPLEMDTSVQAREVFRRICNTITDDKNTLINEVEVTKVTEYSYRALGDYDYTQLVLWQNPYYKRGTKAE